MKIVDFSKTNSVVSKYIAEMRDVNIQNDRMRFRKNIERIGQVMAYEISKELNYEKLDVSVFSRAYQIERYCEIIEEFL